MNFWVKILMLMSLCFNLGAGALEDCASDGEFGDNHHSLSSKGQTREESARLHAEEHESGESPLCHHESCHFGHCAHLLLVNHVALKESIAELNLFELPQYASTHSFEFQPNHDRPPTQA
ncbi:MAG: hypothetical protein EOP07_06700 [Proteobacteria bacterium]|nr:MAG: hypothetical protein EOP07_06700 [Pseudomonadota bacterium]